jgi:hypothetical protein
VGKNLVSRPLPGGRTEQADGQPRWDGGRGTLTTPIGPRCPGSDHPARSIGHRRPGSALWVLPAGQFLVGPSGTDPFRKRLGSRGGFRVRVQPKHPVADCNGSQGRGVPVAPPQRPHARPILCGRISLPHFSAGRNLRRHNASRGAGFAGPDAPRARIFRRAAPSDRSRNARPLVRGEPPPPGVPSGVSRRDWGWPLRSPAESRGAHWEPPPVCWRTEPAPRRALASHPARRGRRCDRPPWRWGLSTGGP